MEPSISNCPIGNICVFVNKESGLGLITVRNNTGASMTLCTLGAGIAAMRVPDRDGKLADVVIGYMSPASYNADGPCAGKTPGRYANRIAKGLFTLDGNTYKLPINNGPNHLHGGPEGYQNRIWDFAVVGEQSVKFTIKSPDGDAGYPGNVEASVTYTLTDDNKIVIDYEATSDAPTVINLTNHSYFNLGGHNAGARRAMDQLLQLNCSRWLPTDDTLIPTGEVASVEGTPMDFRKQVAVGERIFPKDAEPSTETLITDFDAIRFGKGYDNCWIADTTALPGQDAVAEATATINTPDGRKLPVVATLTDVPSGRVLTVATDQPAVQVYGGNWVSGCPEGKEGATYADYCAVAMECQGCPDAPNKPGFPSQLLTPEKPYRRSIVFSFSTTK